MGTRRSQFEFKHLKYHLDTYFVWDSALRILDEYDYGYGAYKFDRILHIQPLCGRL